MMFLKHLSNPMEVKKQFKVIISNCYINRLFQMGTCSSQAKQTRKLKIDWDRKRQEQIYNVYYRFTVDVSARVKQEIILKIFQRFNNNVKDEQFDEKQVLGFLRYAMNRNHMHRKAKELEIQDARIMILKITGQCKHSLTKIEFIEYLELLCKNDTISSIR